MEVLTNQNEGNLENLGVNENHRYLYNTTSVSLTTRGIPIPEKISIRNLGHASSVDALRLKIRGIFLLAIAWHHPGANFKWGLAPGWCPAVARTASQGKLIVNQHNEQARAALTYSSKKSTRHDSRKQAKRPEAPQQATHRDNKGARGFDQSRRLWESSSEVARAEKTSSC